MAMPPGAVEDHFPQIIWQGRQSLWNVFWDCPVKLVWSLEERRLGGRREEALRSPIQISQFGTLSLLRSSSAVGPSWDFLWLLLFCFVIVVRWWTDDTCKCVDKGTLESGALNALLLRMLNTLHLLAKGSTVDL